MAKASDNYMQLPKIRTSRTSIKFAHNQFSISPAMPHCSNWTIITLLSNGQDIFVPVEITAELVELAELAVHENDKLHIINMNEQKKNK